MGEWEKRRKGEKNAKVRKQAIFFGVACFVSTILSVLRTLKATKDKHLAVSTILSVLRTLKATKDKHLAVSTILTVRCTLKATKDKHLAVSNILPVRCTLKQQGMSL